MLWNEFGSLVMARTVEAIKWATGLGYANVTIETEAQLVRDAYNAEGENVSIFDDLLKNYPGYSVKRVYRKVNRLAHAFARAAHTFERVHN